MRRAAAVLMSATALVISLVTPASASAPLIMDRLAVDEATSDGQAAGTLPCLGDQMDTSVAPSTRVDGPADPASSSPVSWGQSQALPVGIGWGPATQPGAASDFGTFAIDVYNGPSGAAVMGAVDVDKSTGQVTRMWFGKSPIPAGAPGQWATIDASAVTYAWKEYSPSTGAVLADAGSHTLADFSTLHPDGTADGMGYAGFFVFGCNGETGWSVQHLETGSAAAPAVADFGTLRNDVQIGLSNSFIVAGSRTAVTGSAQYLGAPYIKLESRTLPGAMYTADLLPVNRYGGVDDLVCNASGSVCRLPLRPTVRPLHNTIYKWSYPAANGVDAASSAYVMVHVLTKLKAVWPTVAPTRGHSFTVPGATLPAKPGSMVTLWGKHGSVTYRLASARVGSNGNFRLVGTPSTAGPWTFWVTIPAGTGNEAGKSTAKAYTVR